MVRLQLFAQLCLLGAGASVAFAQVGATDNEAAKAFKLGVEAYQRAEFEGAARLFERAYEIEHDIESLFAWAQAERLAGNCRAAVPLYQRILDGEPSDEQRAAVVQVLGICERQLERAPPPPTPAAPTDASKPSTRWGWALFSSGAGLLTVATVLYAAGKAKSEEAQPGGLPAQQARIDKVRRLRRGARATGVIGAASLISGVISLRIGGKRKEGGTQLSLGWQGGPVIAGEF